MKDRVSKQCEPGDRYLALTSEQAVQVVSGSRRQGDLQDCKPPGWRQSFDGIQAFALSLSGARLAGGRLIS